MNESKLRTSNGNEKEKANMLASEHRMRPLKIMPHQTTNSYMTATERVDVPVESSKKGATENDKTDLSANDDGVAIDIKCVEWKEFETYLSVTVSKGEERGEIFFFLCLACSSVFHKCTHFEARMKSLQEYCTPVDDCFILWIDIPNHWTKSLRFIISRGGWFTNCTSEERMMGFKSQPSQLLYYYIRFYEEHDTVTPLLSLRTDLDGRVGELVWLQKGTYCSGTTMLQLFQLLDQAIGVALLYLHDDAKLTVLHILSHLSFVLFHINTSNNNNNNK
ncbi:hypothetical protein RFI_18811 [Reticulomyxa filosa]|uniref:Uncharacterized protein n=1 Tax=Reticulomyxa filosa TaxID=46433 RepID=X6MZH1_RETFI|nr:hypothetical protein RFI_18811 [Reticulomyxa filosa]|eukprot:ETO18455.1 hypothetical protein RFI_18811 [Reticulomyxa filosa]